MNQLMAKYVRSLGLLTLVSLSSLVWSSSAYAATSADATIFNKATLTYNGGTAKAGVAVNVALVGATPILSGIAAASVTSGDTIDIEYTITSGANGLDNYDLSATSVDTVTAGAGSLNAPSIIFLDDSNTQINNLDIGAVISAAVNTDTNKILIPAGAETNNIAVGMYMVINGDIYKVKAITPGTVPDINTSTGPSTLTEIEFDTTDTISDSFLTGGDFIAGDVAAGIQIGEIKTLTIRVDSGALTGSASQGTHDINLVIDPDTGTALSGEADILLTVDAPTVSFLKKVALVTGADGAGNGGTVGAYVTTPFDVESGDILEYQLTAAPVTGQSLTDAEVVDAEPDYTDYVTDSLTLNGVQYSTISAVTDGGTLPLIAGFKVNSQGGASDDGTGNDGVGELGTIDAGNNATVTFRVIVD